MDKRENRQNKRAAASFSVVYRVIDPFEARLRFGEAEKDGIAEDLSSGGLSLSGGDLIAESATVLIQFRAVQKGSSELEAGSRKFQLRGDVRYCRPEGTAKSFKMGIKFGKLTQAESRFIEQLTS